MTARVMIRIGVLGLMVMAAAQAGAAAQHKATAGVAGKWVLKMADGPHGPVEMPLTLEQDGSTVTAVLVPPGHGGEFHLSGEFVKNELTLSIEKTEQNMAFRLKATLQPDGTLKGYTSSEMGDSTWIATRVKPLD